MTLLKYSFDLKTRVEFGEGVICDAGKECKNFDAKKVLIVSDKGVINAGLVEPVMDSLKKEGIDYMLYDQVVPNPRDVHCDEGYGFAKDEKIDLIIAVGGGSAMDTGKAIGTLLTNGKTIKDWCGVQLLNKDTVPLIAIPTTAGTGSEVTPFAVITDTEKHVKLNVFDERVAPKVALVDPGVMLKLPGHIMAACGVDALTHAVESYTCNVATPHTDANALYAMEIIQKNLRAAVKNPTIESCTGMMLGSTIAGIGFGYSDCAAVHCIGEALGGKYDIPHGVAMAILLPTVTKYNIDGDLDKHVNIARSMGVDVYSKSKKEAALEGVKELQRLCDDVDIPRMKDIKEIDPKDFRDIAIASEQNVSNASNPTKLTVDDYFNIINEVYNS